jgi:voltage-gated potassium channel
MTTQQLIDRLGHTRSTLASWQFGQLAVFFVVLLFVLPILHHGVLVKSITTLFVINSLLVTDSSNPNARELRWIGWSLAIVAGVSNVLEELHLSEALTFATKYVAITSHALLFMFCAASILGIVFRMRRITLDGILASVVVYELIGLVFAQIYTLARLINPVSLQMPPSVAANTENFQVEMIYYSFVTLATLGYGDIVPDTNVTRSVAIVEAVIGQFYVAVVVALLVSAFVAQRMQDQTDPSNNHD